MNVYHNKFLLATVLAIGLSGNLFAHTPEKKTSAWSSSIGLGYTGTTGNTNNDNLSTQFNLSYKNKPWESQLNINTLWHKSDGERTAENYNGNIATNYFFAPRSFAFLVDSATYDYFSTYDITSSHAGGIGYELIKTKTITLNVKGGPGYRYQRVAATRKGQHQFIFLIASDFTWQMSDNAEFSQKLSSEIGNPNIFTSSETAITANLVGHLSAKLSYLATHNSYIPPLSDNTSHWDTISQVALIYTF